jgi:hypothetical protein
MHHVINKEIGKERAKAWIYAVINPLLEGLRTHAYFLKGKNWTFRGDTQDLEFIRPLEAYVERFTFPNFEDFVASNPTIGREIAKHDELRKNLLERCRAAFKHLFELESFQKKAASCLSLYREAEQTSSYRTGEREEQSFRRLAAELVVNNIRELPVHYLDSGFWHKFASEFLVLRSGKVFGQVDQAGVELQRHDQRLSAALIKLRSDLAEKYDVPHAPYYEPVAREK